MTTHENDESSWGFHKRTVPPGPQPDPKCPTDICSQCFPGEPCMGAACHVCTVSATREKAGCPWHADGDPDCIHPKAEPEEPLAIDVLRRMKNPDGSVTLVSGAPLAPVPEKHADHG